VLIVPAETTKLGRLFHIGLTRLVKSRGWFKCFIHRTRDPGWQKLVKPHPLQQSLTPYRFECQLLSVQIGRPRSKYQPIAFANIYYYSWAGSAIPIFIVIQGISYPSTTNTEATTLAGRGVNECRARHYRHRSLAERRRATW